MLELNSVLIESFIFKISSTLTSNWCFATRSTTFYACTGQILGPLQLFVLCSASKKHSHGQFHAICLFAASPYHLQKVCFIKSFQIYFGGEEGGVFEFFFLFLCLPLCSHTLFLYIRIYFIRISKLTFAKF